MKTAIVVIAILGVAFASIVKRQAEAPQEAPQARARLQPVPYVPPPPQYQPHTYILPADAELVVGPIKSSFSCNDRIYGYYADVDNDCEIFHVCVPFVDEQNNPAPIIYSFICGNLTVFDQANLICALPQDATPCAEAPSLYTVNENFGKTDRPIQRE